MRAIKKTIVPPSRPRHIMQFQSRIGGFYMSSLAKKARCVGHVWATPRRIARGVGAPQEGRLVMEDDEEDSRNYLVVCNSEEQYSIWPSHKPIPRGWRSVGKEARKAECLRHIESVWIDMRPRSLRENAESRER